MSEPRRFTVAPTPRCCRPVENSPGGFCGELATWAGKDPDDVSTRFFCDEHRPPIAVPLGGDVQYRRACLTVQVYIAAVSDERAIAHGEAFEQLQRAVGRVGGVLNIVSATSEIGVGSFPARRGGLRMAKARA